MTNLQQAEAVIKKYKFNFSEIPKEEIRKLIEKEISNFQEESSEYIRPREEIIESLVLENQKIIKIPIVRNGKQATIGYQPDVWKNWK